jgi:DNA-binding PadR family transcriptional regulator
MAKIVVLSNKEAVALKLISKLDEAAYGLELVRESKGALKRGTVYVLLDRMEEKGYVKSKRDENLTLSGKPRRRYRLTKRGGRALELYRGLEKLTAEIFQGRR